MGKPSTFNDAVHQRFPHLLEWTIQGVTVQCAAQEAGYLTHTLQGLPVWVVQAVGAAVTYLSQQSGRKAARHFLADIPYIQSVTAHPAAAHQVIEAYAKVAVLSGFKVAHGKLGDLLQGKRLLVPTADAPHYPPYCNTGGYGFSEKNAADSASNPNDTHLTTIDWLRVTTTDLEAFQATMSDVVDTNGLLDCADIDVKWETKGLHGYDRSASLLVWRDNDYINVGHIGTSESGRNQGGLFELTGVGCKILQLEYPELWQELYSLFTHFEWRISRVDIALDLMGDYAKEQGYTVPKLLKSVVHEGLLRSDKLKNPNMKQSLATVGDWTPLLVGDVSVEDYDPLVHCPSGLTAYIGNRKGSEDFFRFYEKGKQLLGALAEADDIDRGWVRIEHEMSRKASGRIIPLDVMLRPDEYFCANRSGARAILDAFRAHLSLADAKQWQHAKFKREKRLLLSKKIFWAKHSYGRLVRTLLDHGLDTETIIDQLSRTTGLKDFIFDVLEHLGTESGGESCLH